MTPHPQAGVHFRDAIEHLHLTDTHVLLHPQLINCIYAPGWIELRLKVLELELRVRLAP